MPKQKKKQTEKMEQLDKFKAMAREHGCDESEAAFDDKLKKITSKSPAKRDGT